MSTHISIPDGEYQIWVQLPSGLDSATAYKELVNNRLSVIPGSVFSANPEKYSNFIRLEAALYDDHTRPYLQQIGKILKIMLEEKKNF